MKVLITEKQLKKLIKKTIEASEQEDPEAAQPTAGTSDSQKGDQKGYPEVTTWSDIVGSKLTRGVANKINNEPRPDLVNRDGPANQLK
jgi:hypothetical protein